MAGGLQGMSRLPRDTVRARRNATKFASNFVSLIGDGLAVDGGLVVVDLVADAGLEFIGGDLAVKIQSPLICDAAGLGIDPGDGLAISGTELVVDLAATPGLEFSGGDLQAKVTDPIDRGAAGLGLNLDADYLWVDGAGGVSIINPITADIVSSNDITAGSFTTAGLITAGSLDVDTLNLNGNVISDSTGVISFSDDDLTTTGHVGIGIGASASHQLYVADFSIAASQISSRFYTTHQLTAGYCYNTQMLTKANPAAASAATTRGLVLTTQTQSGNAQNITGNIDALWGYGYHSGTGRVDYLSGVRFSAYNGSTGIITNAYAAYLRVYNTNVGGTIDNGYALFLDHPVITGAITNYYGIYNNATVGSNLLGKDNVKSFFGTGEDASVYYDGIDLWINSDEVGVGSLKIGDAVNYTEIEPDGDLIFHGTASLANNSIAVAQLATAVQDLMPNLNITVGDEDGANKRTITIDPRDAAGSDIAERFLIRVWISIADYSTPSAAGNTVAVEAGTVYETETANAAYKIISTPVIDGNNIQIGITIAGAATRYIMAEIDGRIYSSGAVTWAA